MDMTDDIFADQSYGKIALQKIASPHPDFRLYEAGWLGNPNVREIMEVKGAVFRKATRGPNKGQLRIMVPDTRQTVHVTAEEMKRFEAAP